MKIFCAHIAWIKMNRQGLCRACAKAENYGNFTFLVIACLYIISCWLGGLVPMFDTDSQDCNRLMDDFDSLGLNHIAYIKAMQVEGRRMHAVYAANGTPLTIVDDRAVAIATALQHDLEALSLH